MYLAKALNYRNFNKYGIVLENSINDNNFDNLFQEEITLQENEGTNIFQSDGNFKIIPCNGVGVINIIENGSVVNSFFLSFPVLIYDDVIFSISAYTCDFKFIIRSSDELKIKIIDNQINSAGINMDIAVETLYSISLQERKSSFVFKGETHPFYEICYVNDGKIEIEISNEKICMESGDLILIDRGTFHSSSSLMDNPSSFLNIDFLCHNNISQIVNKKIVCDDELKILLNRIYKEYILSNIYSHDMILSYLTQFVITLLRSETKVSIDEEPIKTNNSIILNCCKYIENNIGSELSLEVTSKAVGVSKSTLSKLYVKYMKCPYSQYVLNLRLDKAKEMIFNTDKTFTEISEILGFCSPYYFSVAFKKKYGFSPKKYLKSIKNGQL